LYLLGIKKAVLFNISNENPSQFYMEASPSPEKYLPQKRYIKTVTRFYEGKVMLYIVESRILEQVNPKLSSRTQKTMITNTKKIIKSINTHAQTNISD